MDAVKWFPLERLGELEARLADLAKSGRLSRRRDALAACLGLCGLRVGEVIAANVGDLWRPTGTLSVRTLKKGRPRKVPLDSSLVDALFLWRDAAQANGAPGAPLLPNNRGGRLRRDQLERFAKRLITELLGFPLTFHCLRHTFAMRLYARTKDVFLVQRLLGHRDLKSTQVYARSLEEVPPDCLPRL